MIVSTFYFVFQVHFYAWVLNIIFISVVNLAVVIISTTVIIIIIVIITIITVIIMRSTYM